jgi:hypothetical protein
MIVVCCSYCEEYLCCYILATLVYEGVSKSFRTESITKTTTINTRLEATKRVMMAKLTRLTHKMAIQLNIMAESCTIHSSCSRRPVRKLLDTPSYVCVCFVCSLKPPISQSCEQNTASGWSLCIQHFSTVEKKKKKQNCYVCNFDMDLIGFNKENTQVFSRWHW